MKKILQHFHEDFLLNDFSVNSNIEIEKHSMNAIKSNT